MPIQLNYTDPDSGLNISASYWFATAANIDTLSQLVQYDLSGYLNLAAKNAGKQPFKKHIVIPTFGQLGLTGGSTLNQFAAAAYVFALANDLFFSGGTIV